MRTFKDEQIEAAIESRATEWFVMHRERALDQAEHRAFLSWLRASPRHVDAYLSLVEMAQKLSCALREGEGGGQLDPRGVEGVEAIHFMQRRGSGSRGASWWQRERIAMAAAILLAALGGIFWALKRVDSSESVYIPPGKQRMLTLADGSMMHLNSDTRVVLRYSGMQRLIELQQGQGLFSVKHDARRPFIVRAGSLDVVALGTEFQVSRRGSSTDVAVVEGRIEIVGERADVSAHALRLHAGQQVSYGRERAAVPRELPDATAVIAWTRKEVTFAATRLEDVAAQFDRYTGASIEIEDEALRNYRVSGVFQAYDLDSFLAYLKQFQGVVVEQEGDEVRVSRSKR